MEALRDLFATFEKKYLAEIFAKSIQKPRHNYFPQVLNFFDLYFKKNVPEYPFQ